MRSLGIDIGRYSIKVVEVITSNRKHEVTRAKQYKIHNKETSDQEIDILQTLNAISKDFDTDSAKVTCSIRQQYVSTRKLFFPFKERVKIQKSLAFELEDDIPLNIEKAVYDSKILKFHEKTAEVMAMACLSDEIEKQLEIFEKAHIDPDIITPELCAIANLYEDWSKSPEEKTSSSQEGNPLGDKIVVQIGHSKSVIGIVREGYLIWGRSVMWGAEKVAGAISQKFQVPYSTAHEMMPEKAFVLLSSGTASKDQIKMSEAVGQSFEPLIQAIRLTVMLANTEYGANIGNVELIGGPSKIKNLPAFFTQELEITSNASNPLLATNGPMISGQSQLSDEFIMATGLAIEGLRRPVSPAVNFRQMQFAKKNLTFEKFVEKWGYTAKILAAAYVCFMIYGVAIDSLSTELEEVSNDVLLTQASKIANLKGRSASPSKIRRYVRDNEKKAKVVKVYQQLDDLNSPLKFINEVSQILPPNKDNKSYDVRRFFVENDEINIQGLADSDETIKKIKKALQGVAANQKLNPIKPTIIPEGDRKMFAFKFKVKRKN